jgi:hypothetical protein
MHNQNEAGQRADECAKQQDIEDHLLAFMLVFAGQKVIGAHPEIERKHRDGCADDQKDLLEEPVLALRQIAHKNWRQDKREGEAERLGKHQPERTLRQRILFFNDFSHQS